MNPKTTLMLVVALLLAVVGVWLAQPSADDANKVVDTGPKPLFELTADDVNAFEIKQGEGPTCSFVREDGKWKMTAPAVGSAEQFAVNGDVGKVVGMEYTTVYNDGKGEKISDELTSLNKPLKIIKFTDKDGKSRVIKVGAGQKLSTRTYVQIEGEPKVYLVNSDLAADLRRKPAEYRGKRVAEFKTADAVRIQISGSQNFTLAKADEGWTIEEPVRARADLALVNKILNGVANLSALQFVEDEPASLHPYGLTEPRLTVAITTEQKTPKETAGPTSQPTDIEYDVTTSTIALALGGTAEDRAFAKMVEPASNAVFQVNQSLMADLGPTLSDLRDKRIAGFDTNRANAISMNVDGEFLKLVKLGAQWSIAGDDGMTPVESAEYAAVDDLLKAIREAKALGFEEGESAAFGFEAPRATLEISLTGQPAPVKLRIGGLTPSRTGVYVKNETDNAIAVVPTATADSLAVRPITFRSREMLSFDSSNATAVQVVRDGITRSVSKKINDWEMTSPVTGGVELPNLEKILADLSSLRGRRVVAPASDAATYGLNEPAIRASVTLTLPGAATEGEDASPPAPTTEQHTILFARHDDKVYAMRDGADVICEVDGKIADDLESELLDTNILRTEPSSIESLAFGGAESFAFEKKGEGWTLVGESTFPVDAAKITALLNALRDLHSQRYVAYAGANPAEFQLDDPALTITVRNEQGEEQQLRISSKIPTEGGRYASTAAIADRVFVIGPDDVTKLSKQVTDFQKP
mgnify:CR=1 FL=1